MSTQEEGDKKREREEDLSSNDPKRRQLDVKYGEKSKEFTDRTKAHFTRFCELFTDLAEEPYSALEIIQKLELFYDETMSEQASLAQMSRDIRSEAFLMPELKKSSAYTKMLICDQDGYGDHRVRDASVDGDGEEDKKEEEEEDEKVKVDSQDKVVLSDWEKVGMLEEIVELYRGMLSSAHWDSDDIKRKVGEIEDRWHGKR